MTIDLTDKAIRTDIEGRLFDLGRRIAQLMNTSSPTDIGATVDRAQFLAEALAGERGYTAGENVAKGLLDLLVPPDEQNEREFWATSLGKALAWWTGNAPAGRTRMVTEEVMGVSRQAVHRMISDGHLLVGPDTEEISPASLRAHLQRRFPHEVKA